MNELVSLKSPISVNFEVTPVCDLACEFCFNAEMECKKLSHPPLKRVMSILDKLAEAEVFEVRLFGGEFFVYPYCGKCWNMLMSRISFYRSCQMVPI